MCRVFNKILIQPLGKVKSKMMVIRRLLGLSQGEVGRLLGVTQGRISQWESGIFPVPTERKKQIADIFNVEVATLFGPEEAAKR
jgi:transcriptional regulator with XRE-family HTH domain